MDLGAARELVISAPHCLHSLSSQHRRAGDECIFMLLGEVIKHSRTKNLFLHPRHEKTADYIEGRYG